jgi:NAD(P)-dependent dehydrogenase (short-subunit alcohol dehydrogenase family)
MKLELENKVAIVTGASKGIGLAIVQALVSEGARVLAVSRNGSDDLAALGPDVVSHVADLTCPEGAKGSVTAALDTYGQVDIVVNNVGGVLAAHGGFLETSDEAWSDTLNFNLMSTVRMSRAALPALLKNADGGVIINVSSTQAKLPSAMNLDYCVSKAALDNLSKGLAEEFTSQGVRTVTVAPGPVETPFWTDEGGFAHMIAEQAGTDVDAAVSSVIPEMMGLTSGRMVHADEIASVVTMAASPRMEALTGSTITVDAGMIKTVG